MSQIDSAFEASLDELGVTVTHANRAALGATLDEAIVGPAVGVALAEDFVGSGDPLADAGIDVDPTPAALDEAVTGVSTAELGIGDYGSLVLTLTDSGSELVSLFVERHVVLVQEEDITPDMDAAVDTIEELFAQTHGSAIIATGPSATADMGALVQGAHGPESVHVIVVREEE